MTYTNKFQPPQLDPQIAEAIRRAFAQLTEAIRRELMAIEKAMQDSSAVANLHNGRVITKVVSAVGTITVDIPTTYKAKDTLYGVIPMMMLSDGSFAFETFVPSSRTLRTFQVSCLNTGTLYCFLQEQ